MLTTIINRNTTCDVLPDPTLKQINLAESHAASFKLTKDNFEVVQKYLRNIRCYIANAVDQGTSPITTAQIKNAVRSMIYIVEINFNQPNGTSVTLDNGCVVTRNGNAFVVQHPETITKILHALRIKQNRQYAAGYDLSIDVTDNIVLTFAVLPNEILELEIFG